MAIRVLEYDSQYSPFFFTCSKIAENMARLSRLARIGLWRSTISLMVILVPELLQIQMGYLS